MNQDRSKRHSKRIRFILFFNIGLFALIGFGLGEEYLRNREIEAEISRMQAENAALEAQKLSSLALIDTLSSSYYVEGEARQSGLGKEGEQLIIIQDSDISSASLKSSVTHDDIPNPLRWYYFFFDPERFNGLSEI